MQKLTFTAAATEKLKLDYMLSSALKFAADEITALLTKQRKGQQAVRPRVSAIKHHMHAAHPSSR